MFVWPLLGVMQIWGLAASYGAASCAKAISKVRRKENGGEGPKTKPDIAGQLHFVLISMHLIGSWGLVMLYGCHWCSVKPRGPSTFVLTFCEQYSTVK